MRVSRLSSMLCLIHLSVRLSVGVRRSWPTHSEPIFLRSTWKIKTHIFGEPLGLLCVVRMFRPTCWPVSFAFYIAGKEESSHGSGHGSSSKTTAKTNDVGTLIKGHVHQRSQNNAKIGCNVGNSDSDSDGDSGAVAKLSRLISHLGGKIMAKT